MTGLLLGPSCAGLKMTIEIRMLMKRFDLIILYVSSTFLLKSDRKIIGILNLLKNLNFAFIMSRGNILIIDDEEKLRSLFARIFSLEDFTVFEAANVKSGLKLLEKEMVNVVITDMKLPDGTGMEALRKVKEYYPLVEVIVLTAFGNIKDGVQAMKLGAFDYIQKGDGDDQIIPVVNRAIEKAILQFRVQELEKKVSDKYSFESIIGHSEAISNSIALAKRVTNTDATVLLLGETGTGKEIFAQAIHYSGPRKLKQFVALNCSAFAKDLLESEMFGYKAGAFTGALKDKKGLFEEAHGGTIFLDEIGELDHELQAKLLRVLESGTFIKAGDTHSVKVDVRIIAATNRNILPEADNKQFRQDLYYRISAFTIHLPALRERREDIEALSYYFMHIYAARTNSKVALIDKKFLEVLKKYDFKGNIRELKNIIERAVILADSETLTASLLPLEVEFADSHSEQSLSLEEVEKFHILKVLKIAKGNKTKAAEILGIGQTTLYRKLHEYGLEG